MQFGSKFLQWLPLHIDWTFRQRNPVSPHRCSGVFRLFVLAGKEAVPSAAHPCLALSPVVEKPVSSDSNVAEGADRPLGPLQKYSSHEMEKTQSHNLVLGFVCSITHLFNKYRAH